MRKLPFVILLFALAATLAACGGGEQAKPFRTDMVQSLLTSGAFSEELEPIDTEVACALYGIDPDTVQECAVYGSTGATAEEAAFFLLTDEASAQAALKQLGYRVEDRTADLASYLPLEVPKLEKAVLEQRGASVLLVIAADYDPVSGLLEK